MQILPSLEAHIGEVVTIQLIPIPGFQIERKANDEYILHPAGKTFTAQGLENYLNANRCDVEGCMTLRGAYLREVYRDKIVIARRGEAAQIIARDAIRCITIGGIIVHEG